LVPISCSLHVLYRFYRPENGPISIPGDILYEDTGLT